LWLPIAFHSVLGWYYANSSSDNTNRYPFNGNWRYRLQRISGYVGVFFILYHVATLRWGLTWLVPGGTEWSAEAAASTTAAVLRGSFDRGITLGGLMVSCMYLGGASLLVFHFANGLWTAAITWGITVSKQAQERWGVACLGLGAALMLMAWSAVFGFLLLDPQKAAEVEARMGGHSASGEAVKTQPPK
jgi:succinate dehydrogenase / fumarate reductase cytochrome b subunit